MLQSRGVHSFGFFLCSLINERTGSFFQESVLFLLEYVLSKISSKNYE